MKVFYNESCNICRAEINLYKRQNIENIEWIFHNKAAEKEISKSAKSLLRRLHVKKEGEIFDGAEAFLLVWKNIPKYKFLYNFFKNPITFKIFYFFYEIAAYFLYIKNKSQLYK